MRLQFGTQVRNAKAQQLEVVTGASARLQFWSGTIPTNPASNPTGTLLAEIQLPTDWIFGANNGSVSKAGTWAGVGAVNGVAKYFRLVSANGTCRMQGDVGVIGQDVAMTMDSVTVSVGGQVTVGTFTLVEGYA